MELSFVKVYLLLYNGVLSLGWLSVLCPAVRHIAAGLDYSALQQGTVPGLYLELQFQLLIFQTAAILEVLHCILGWVRSPVLTTLMQVYSRVFIVWAIMESVPGSRDSVGVLIVVLAWGITEVVRYAYYVCSLLGHVPHVLVWCRYTFFYVLYPLGVLGEMLVFMAALPVVKARRQWELQLPNPLNFSFSFYYFLMFTMFLYLPLFPQLYGHMIRQRAKYLVTSVDVQKKKE